MDRLDALEDFHPSFARNTRVVLLHLICIMYVHGMIARAPFYN